MKGFVLKTLKSRVITAKMNGELYYIVLPMCFKTLFLVEDFIEVKTQGEVKCFWVGF